MTDGRLAFLYLIIIAAITLTYLDEDSLSAAKHAFMSVTASRALASE